MKLTESLPTAVDGHEVYTDFRDWIRFEQMLMDGDITDEEKAALMTSWYKETRPNTIHAALNGLVAFYLCGEDESTNDNDSRVVGRVGAFGRVYDYDADAGMIYAAFRQAYGVDLAEVEYLHWWAFRAMMENVPDETRLARVMSIRSTDTSKMKGEERAHYERLKRLCAIGGAQDMRKPLTLEERDSEILRRVARKGGGANGV